MDQPLRNLDHGFDLQKGDVGVSVRAGNKWAIEPEIEFDLVEQYSDMDSEDKIVGRGRSIGFWKGAFSELPDSLIQIEHNYDARDKIILLDMLERGYLDFNEDSEVVALIYERIK